MTARQIQALGLVLLVLCPFAIVLGIHHTLMYQSAQAIAAFMSGLVLFLVGLILVGTALMIDSIQGVPFR